MQTCERSLSESGGKGDSRDQMYPQTHKHEGKAEETGINIAAGERRWGKGGQIMNEETEGGGTAGVTLLLIWRQQRVPQPATHDPRKQDMLVPRFPFRRRPGFFLLATRGGKKRNPA